MKYTMKPKVRELADRILAVITAWDSVECVCLNEAATADTLDPYFALILDVYYTDGIPSTAQRAAAFPDNAAFETSPTNSKDRFLVGDLPVRIEYKRVSRIEEQVGYAERSGSELWKIRDSGTYVFYRLLNGIPLYQRGEWLASIKTRLGALADDFWVRMRSFYQSSMEHYLSDLGASLPQEDSFNYLVSSASFIKYACSALFMENGRFEPSHRAYFDQVTRLPTLPEGFAGRFESYLRADSELPPDRKYEIAKLIARSIVGL